MIDEDFERIYKENKQVYTIEKVKPEDIEPIMYHVSNPYFRNVIEKEGLKPQVGDSYECHWSNIVEKDDLIPLVFLDKENTYDSTYDDDRYEVYTENLDKDKFIYDPDRRVSSNGWICYMDVIPPENIKLIYRGTGSSK